MGICLFVQKELSLSRRSSRVSHRKSFISTTSPTLPRCHSPISGNISDDEICFLTYNKREINIKGKLGKVK